MRSARLRGPKGPAVLELLCPLEAGSNTRGNTPGSGRGRWISLCFSAKKILFKKTIRIIQIFDPSCGGWASLIAQLVKNLPAVQETPV